MKAIQIFILLLTLPQITVAQNDGPSKEQTVEYLQNKSRTCAGGSARLESIDYASGYIEIRTVNRDVMGYGDEITSYYKGKASDLYSNIPLETFNIKARNWRHNIDLSYGKISCSTGDSCMTYYRKGTQEECRITKFWGDEKCKGGAPFEQKMRQISWVKIPLCLDKSDTEKIIKSMTHLITLDGGEADLF